MAAEELENLFEETTNVIARNGKTVENVQWVGSKDGDHALTWGEFAAIAQNTNYNSGHGTAMIAVDLVVVGESWWLERHTYDGAEWWEFKSLPIKRNAQQFTHVSGSRLLEYSLKEINP